MEVISEAVPEKEAILEQVQEPIPEIDLEKMAGIICMEEVVILVQEDLLEEVQAQDFQVLQDQKDQEDFIQDLQVLEDDKISKNKNSRLK